MRPSDLDGDTVRQSLHRCRVVRTTITDSSSLARLARTLPLNSTRSTTPGPIALVVDRMWCPDAEESEVTLYGASSIKPKGSH